MAPHCFCSPAVDAVIKTAGSIDAARDILTRFVDGLIEGETHDAWESRLKGIVEDRGDKPKAVFMTIRLAVTGRDKSPPVFDTTQILGIPEVKRRVAATLMGL